MIALQRGNDEESIFEKEKNKKYFESLNKEQRERWWQNKNNLF